VGLARNPSSRSNTSDPDNNLYMGVPGSCAPYKILTKSVGISSGGNMKIYSDASKPIPSNNPAYINKSTGSETERKTVLIPLLFNRSSFSLMLSSSLTLNIVTCNSSPPSLTSASARAVSLSDSTCQKARYFLSFKYFTIALARPTADNVIPIVPFLVTNEASSV
jgi:hypothetical protein